MALSLFASIIRGAASKTRDRTRGSNNHLTVADFPPRVAPESKLPPELTDHIIDYLYNDFASLKSCSLVCSSWLPTSRHHLWSGAHVSLEFGSPQGDYETFLKTTPHIACSIRSLLIRFSAPGSKRCVKDEIRWMNDTLLPIIQSMNNLQTFSLSGRVGVHMADFFNLISNQLSSVVSLNFKSCQFETFLLFSDFVWSFPRLSYLGIFELMFSTDLDTGMLTIRDTSLPRPPLERLHLRLDESGCDVVLLVTTWMVGNGLAARLNDVRITQGSPSASGLRLFIHMIGSKLKRLTIEVTNPLVFPLPNFSIFTLVAHCTNLETLVISSANLRWLPLVATYITASPHITRIILKVTNIWDSPDAFAGFNWGYFCRTFAPQRFSFAKVFLNVKVATEADRDVAETIINRRLESDSRVCLQVDHA